MINYIPLKVVNWILIYTIYVKYRVDDGDICDKKIVPDMFDLNADKHVYCIGS